MRLSAWLPLAVLSALAVGGAATRPHYGGTLRVEMRASPAALDPAAEDTAPLRSLVFETLVRLDAEGAPQPCLALFWQHDAAAKRWQFSLRPGVKLHDGSPLTAAAAATSLQAALPGLAVTASGDAIIIRANRAQPDLLLDLAHNGWLSTGPFRLATFEPGRRATFAANEEYWGGRPYLDAIDVQFGRGPRDQLADLELGKADIVELGPNDLRRGTDHGRTVWSSAAVSLIVLSFAPAAPGLVDAPRLREALAFSIDRAAMHAVLLQKQGEVSAALLPQWISGYAFAFPTAPDLPRARTLVTALPPAARTLALTYDPSMRAARSLAERVAVNARDAGLTLHVSPQNPRADVRLVEVRLRSLDAAQALADTSTALGLPAPTVATASPAALYESERRLLEGFHAIPLFQLPVLYGAASRVRVNGPPPITKLGDWRFDNVWLGGSAP